MGKTKQILKGKFPEKALTLDQQVETVNKANNHIHEAFLADDQEKVDRQVNNYALWLGGLHPDIQVYAFQVLLKGYKIGFDADDKTEARMARLEERIEASTGYIQYTYDTINHYPWPVEFLDGTTFEDRLEGLANEVREEQDLETVTVDMILQGTAPREQVTIDVAYALCNACAYNLREQADKAADFMFYDRFNRYMGWLLCQQPEIAIMAMRSALTIYKLPVRDRKALPNLQKFVEQYDSLVA